MATLGIYVLARGLEKNGLSLSDVETVSMDQSSMKEALRARATLGEVSDVLREAFGEYRPRV